jgi:hypothetical protein
LWQKSCSYGKKVAAVAKKLQLWQKSCSCGKKVAAVVQKIYICCTDPDWPGASAELAGPAVNAANPRTLDIHPEQGHPPRRVHLLLGKTDKASL